MLRLAFTLLVASLLLSAVGFYSGERAWFEVVRLVAVGCMALSFLLFIINYLRTPDPKES